MNTSQVLSSVTATKRLWRRLSTSPRADRHFNDQTDWLLGNITDRLNISWQVWYSSVSKTKSHVLCLWFPFISLQHEPAKCVWAALILHHVWTMLCYLLMDCKMFSICLYLPQNSDEYKTRSKQQRWRSLARSLSRCDGLQTDFTERTEEKIPSVRSQITSWVILCRKQRSHHPNAINAFYEIKH